MRAPTHPRIPAPAVSARVRLVRGPTATAPARRGVSWHASGAPVQDSVLEAWLAKTQKMAPPRGPPSWARTSLLVVQGSVLEGAWAICKNPINDTAKGSPPSCMRPPVNPSRF